MNDIGQRLRQEIARRGIKQSWLALEAGLPEETVSRIVTGTTPDPKVGTVQKIAAALNLTVGELLGETRLPFAEVDRDEARKVTEWLMRVFDVTFPTVGRHETEDEPRPYTDEPTSEKTDERLPRHPEFEGIEPSGDGGSDATSRRHGKQKGRGRDST